ncbi:MAG TPA: hypothetical protein VLH79_09775 [Chthonomonadales bacterium]|nr:hypothetical protein [Chthonomonadales bacterium]
MYWRLAGTFLLALAVYMAGYLLLSQYVVAARVLHVFTFMGSIAPSSSIDSAQPAAQDPVPGLLLAWAVCGMISSMLAFIVWGCNWSPSRENRRAWLIGIIAFAALLQLRAIPIAFGHPGPVAELLALPLVFAAGAAPGFVLGRAFGNALRAP